MACVLTPQCNFLYGYFQCQLPEDTIEVEVTVQTTKGIHTFKRDHSTQLISCRPWTSRYQPYPSLTKKMKTYLELKDQVADPPHASPTYPGRPNTLSTKKAQTSRCDTTKETKKGNKTHQTNKRQYKLRAVEKTLILPRVSAILIPTTASTTTSMMSNPRRVITPWPSTFPASANLFVTRSWPIPPNKESNPVPAKQKNDGIRSTKIQKCSSQEDNNFPPSSFGTKRVHYSQ